jgi:hypothetical protein
LTLQLYDKKGRFVGDLLANVPQYVPGGRSIEEVSAGRTIYTVDNSRRSYSTPLMPGEKRPHVATQAVLRLKRTFQNESWILGLNGRGKKTFFFAGDSDWHQLELSPAGNWLLAQTSSDESVLINIAAPKKRHRFRQFSDWHGAFSVDDSLFATITRKNGQEQKLLIIDLETDDSPPMEISLPEQTLNGASIEHVSPRGILVGLRGKASKQLWFFHHTSLGVGWLRLTLTSALGHQAVLGMTAKGRFVLSHETQGGNTTFFRYDPGTPGQYGLARLAAQPPIETTPYNRVAYGNERLFYLQPKEGVMGVMSWSLEGPVPLQFATAGSETRRPWLWSIRPSVDGSLVSVFLQLESAVHSDPPVKDATLIFDRHGKRLFALPWGDLHIDHTSQMAVWQSNALHKAAWRETFMLDIAETSPARVELNEHFLAFIHR